jgi:2',3'-cyclic-nucleotide 2'-phosphodiesterase (5'-nucleotidase family)
MTLLHTQDTYGSVVAVSKLNAACAPFANGTYPPKCYGGLGRRMSYINAVTQAAGTNVLLIDGGNFLTGT